MVDATGSAFRYPTTMPGSQSIKSETVGTVAAAAILLERVTDRECAGILSDLTEVAAAHSWRIALDLSKVLLLTSAGLGALIDLHKQCATNKGKLVLFGLSDELLDLMKLTKLNKLLATADSKDAAVKKAAA